MLTQQQLVGTVAARGARDQAAQVYLDEKSLAVRLTLGRDDAALTDVEIDAAMQGAIAALQAQVGARLRG